MSNYVIPGKVSGWNDITSGTTLTYNAILYCSVGPNEYAWGYGKVFLNGYLVVGAQTNAANAGFSIGTCIYAKKGDKVTTEANNATVSVRAYAN